MGSLPAYATYQRQGGWGLRLCRTGQGKPQVIALGEAIARCPAEHVGVEPFLHSGCDSPARRPGLSPGSWQPKGTWVGGE